MAVGFCAPYCERRHDSSSPEGPAPTIATGTLSVAFVWKHLKAPVALVAAALTTRRARHRTRMTTRYAHHHQRSGVLALSTGGKALKFIAKQYVMSCM
jgi:hypothetical protein